MAEAVGGDVADEVAPCGGAGDVERACAGDVAQPFGCVGDDGRCCPLDERGSCDRVSVGVARIDAFVMEVGGPGVEAFLQRPDEGLACRDRVDAEVPAGGLVIDEAELVPAELPLGLTSVGGDEVDGRGADGVVDRSDGADVVTIVRADVCADGEVCGDVTCVGDLSGEAIAGAACEDSGVVFDGEASAGTSLEFVQRHEAGEPVDGAEVGVDGVRELLASRSADAVDEIVRRISGRVGLEASVMSFDVGAAVALELFEFGVGDDDRVVVDAARECDVGGFSVKTVGSDADRDFPRAALGSVGGEGVAVADVAALAQVALVESDVVAGVEAHGDVAGLDVGDGAGLAVRDRDAFAIDRVLRGVVSDDDSLARSEHCDAVVGSGRRVEGSGGDQAVDDRGVEVVDEFVRAGEEHWAAAVGERGQVAVDGSVDHLGGVGGDDHTLVSEVCVDGGGDVPVAEFGEGVLFPFGALASVDVESGDGARVIGRVSEPAASSDFGELVVVADEEHPSAGCELAGDGVFESADVGHAGFVDDEERSVAGLVVGGVPSLDQRVQRA